MDHDEEDQAIVPMISLPSSPSRLRDVDPVAGSRGVGQLGSRMQGCAQDGVTGRTGSKSLQSLVVGMQEQALAVLAAGSGTGSSPIPRAAGLT